MSAATLTTLTTPRCDVPRLMTETGCACGHATTLHAPPINQARRNVLLPLGQAMTFAPREDTRLQLTRGRLWITFEAPPNGLAPRNGDHFIAAGMPFDLLAGEAAVLETVGHDPAALFDVEPVRTLPGRAAQGQLVANLRRTAARVLLGASRQIDAIFARSRHC